MLVRTAPNELNNTAAPTCGSALELYERWWKWSAIVPSDQNTLLVFDKDLHVHRRVPCWSSVVQQAQRCADPFVEHPVACVPADASSTEKFVLAASPREMLGSTTSNTTLTFLWLYVLHLLVTALALLWLYV